MLQSTPFVYVGLRSDIQKVAEGLDAEAYVAKEPENKGSGAVAGLTDGFSGGAVTGRLDLPPITMRLGYSMHARAAQHAVPIQSLRSLVPRPAAAATAAPAEGEAPAVAAAPAAAESGDAAKSPAAWQEIFDLGDDAT